MIQASDLAVEVPALLLGARFGLDATGRVFLFFSGVLWLLGGVYASGYLRDDARRARFFGFYLTAMVGNLGLIVAMDAGTFYLMLAVMTFASYGLVVHSGSVEALRAGRVYIGMAVVGEALLFSALVLLAQGSTSLSFAELSYLSVPEQTRAAIVPLALAGLGVKAGLVGLHMWLPLAHPAAPTPASAVLSGAMIKAGLLGWLRILPISEVGLPEWGGAVIALGLVAALGAAAVGVAQREAKAVLAYSSISQMGLITVAVGVALGSTGGAAAGVGAATLYALHHGLAKGALFLSVGVATGSARGPSRQLLRMIALLLPAASLAGAPLTSGAVAKAALKGAASVAPGAWAGALAVLLPLSAIGTTLLMARFLFLMQARSKPAPPPSPAVAGSWIALVVLSAVVPWLWPADLVGPAVAAALKLGAVWTNVWPIAVGAGVAVAAARVAARRGPSAAPPGVPPGDVLAWIEPPVDALVERVRSASAARS